MTPSDGTRHRCVVSLLPALVAAPPTAADVVDASGSGFTVRHSIEIAAPRADVYLAAVNDIGEWWSDDNTVSGDAGQLYIETKAQGCFCEALGRGAGVVHMTVTFVNPTVMLRLTGGLGPLGLMGVTGNMTWEFDDSESGTTLTWNYAVGGYLSQGLDQVAPTVDAVLMEQMIALKQLVENRAGQQGM